MNQLILMHERCSLQVMHDCPDLRRYLNSLYDCRYDDFFVQLAKVEQAMKADRFLNPHYAFYVREMKVRAFAQLTASYRSLTLGKLHCIVDSNLPSI